ncbi:MAG TPA: hypothetical protein VKA83_09455, partial [Methylomirabilota bacterium]|nr:hypothetical protein [Methylomirabilota bacterium]
GFWTDPVNQLEMRLDKFIRELGIYGELCFPVFVNETDGRVRLGYVDPQEIAQVITDPQNALIKTCVVLKGRANGIPERYLKVVRPNTQRASDDYELLEGVLEDERDPFLDVAYNGACLLFQVNDISNGKRGRSDLLSLIDWVDGYDKFLFDAMDAANLFNSFVWDVELEGMTAPQIKQWVLEFKADIRRNGVFAHNEKVKLAAVAPEMKAMDKDSWARLMRGHILGSKSFPEHWYGLAGEVNFASAKEMGLPPVKRLTRRQKEVKYVIQSLVQFQLDQAVLRGALAREKRTQYRIELPELSMRDQAATVAAAASLATALQAAVAEGWITPETAGRVFNGLISQLGLEIDAKEEFDPTAAAAAKDYRGVDAQQNAERLKAQLARRGEGNGDNIGEKKQTTEKGGQKAA